MCTKFGNDGVEAPQLNMTRPATKASSAAVRHRFFFGLGPAPDQVSSDRQWSESHQSVPGQLAGKSAPARAASFATSGSAMATSHYSQPPSGRRNLTMYPCAWFSLIGVMSDNLPGTGRVQKGADVECRELLQF